MNLIIGAFPYFALPFVISLILVPICKRIGLRLGIYAVENKRTVHHGRIVRIGGVAIYAAFLLSLTILWTTDVKLNGILIGGALVFIGGLLDDIYDLSPKLKLLFQVSGAIAALSIGNLSLDNLHIMSLEISNPLIVKGISFFWLIGITNAINLIDGLDGLSSGICTIVTMTIGMLGFLMGRRDVVILALALSGAILGFLPYNFHPASVFVGDCGAQFMGFTIAALSLLGFKTTALITLGLPILMLFIPISDTLIAIIRRKLKGQKIMEADRGHLHHILMFKLKLGHRKTVEVLYTVTALFAVAAIVSWFNPKIGFLLIVVLVIGADLFIEFTGMINPRFHPVLTLLNRLTGWPHMEDGEDPIDTRNEELAQEAAEKKSEETAAGNEMKPEEIKPEEVKQVIPETESETAAKPQAETETATEKGTADPALEAAVSNDNGKPEAKAEKQKKPKKKAEPKKSEPKKSEPKKRRTTKKQTGSEQKTK
ncbi:MAG: undecaprenyl/decaprenyl-phosphate alpha-N-acetylglucosaminyl 1-phosphate transferase [Solobacterium sp.]|nr:undecaprenyl/decaprenyl-phosphate alpha-N-acetylglucosaminyl 1-phosphate transferase [Solobacterium sp.]